MVKKQFCFNCGEYLGEYAANYSEPETCGKSECEDEALRQVREEEEAAKERAARDDYERYR